MAEPDHLLHVTLQPEGFVYYELECVVGVCMGATPCPIRTEFDELGGDCLGHETWPRDVAPIPVVSKHVGGGLVLVPAASVKNGPIHEQPKRQILNSLIEVCVELCKIEEAMRRPQSYHEMGLGKTEGERLTNRAMEHLRYLLNQLGVPVVERDHEFANKMMAIAKRESMGQSYLQWDQGLQQQYISKEKARELLGKFTNLTES